MQPFPVLGDQIPASDYGGIDLSEEYHQEIGSVITDYDGLAEYVRQVREEKNIRVPYGGYLEKRNLYGVSEHFLTQTDVRNIHLGVDFWADKGTPIFTSFEAKVHSFGFNDQYLDYGGTIILEYRLKTGAFFALYGHLSLNSLTGMQKNNTLRAGTEFARLGGRAENGGWPPHLHLQIMLDMQGWSGDYPGVCSENDLKRYANNCPSPDFLAFIR